MFYHATSENFKILTLLFGPFNFFNLYLYENYKIHLLNGEPFDA